MFTVCSYLFPFTILYSDSILKLTTRDTDNQKKGEMKMMTIKEFYEFLTTAIDTYEDEFDPTGKTRVIGVRWEELDRNEGDEVGRSRHNLDRINEGDMPEYGTDEYENMFELDGTSSMSVNYLLNDLEYAYKNNPDETVSSYYTGTHCYLIGGRHTSNEDDTIDVGEYVIVDASVIVKLY